MSDQPAATRPSPRKLWLSMSATEKRAVAAECAALRGTETWPALSKIVAAAMGFRPETLKRSNREQLATWLAEAAGRMPENVLEQLLVMIHFHGRAELLSSVYEAFGVEHNGPEVEEAVLEKPVDTKKALKGIAALAKKSDREQIRTCLAVMSNSCTDAWRPTVEAALASVTPEAEGK